MLHCPRCHRANPSEAAFCHFDGAELRVGTAATNGQRNLRLPHEFVFPSGRSCRTYEEFLDACQEEWDVARDLLSQGVLQQFFASAGRMDLAQAALKTKNHADPDRALDAFLAGLPSTGERTPHLDLSLRRLTLGTLQVGETRLIRLTIMNEGKGLLHGTMSVPDDVTWLRLGEGKGNGQWLIKTAGQQEVNLRIDTHGLAAPHPYATKLTVVTNGGVVEVPVGLDLEVQPFTEAPFEGMSSPRELAEKMRLHPKPAVPLLESGTIARWFEANGWTYPVSEPTARGVAAVQQFFEGMGLSKPPPLLLSAPEITQSCLPGAVVQGQVLLRTSARKWVYARVESDAPWLRVAAPDISGPQQAVIAVEAHAQHLQPGRVHEATLKITANAGQVLRVPVRLEVRRPEVRARPVPALVVGATAGLIARLLLILPADVGARLGTAASAGDPRLASWLQSPLGTPESMRPFVLLTWWLGAVFAVILLRRRGNRGADLLYGLVAGAVAGLVGSTTVACLMPLFDTLPRLVGSLLRSSPLGAAWFGWPVRIVLALASWTIWGALLGWVVSRAGPAGSRWVARLAELLAWVFGRVGWERGARFFLGQS